MKTLVDFWKMSFVYILYKIVEYYLFMMFKNLLKSQTKKESLKIIILLIFRIFIWVEDRMNFVFPITSVGPSMQSAFRIKEGFQLNESK